MGVRWPWAEHGGAQGPPGPCTAKPMSRALTLLGERATYQSRAQRAADLILGQTPSDVRGGAAPSLHVTVPSALATQRCWRVPTARRQRVAPRGTPSPQVCGGPVTPSP